MQDQHSHVHMSIFALFKDDSLSKAYPHEVGVKIMPW